MAGIESKDRKAGGSNGSHLRDGLLSIEESLKRRWTNEERSIIIQHFKLEAVLTLIALFFLSIFAYLVFYVKINFAGQTKAQDLSDFESKLQFLFRFQTVNLIWIVFSFCCVSFKRGTSPAIIPGIGYEYYVFLAQNHLTNTIEQTLSSFLSELVLITYLDAAQVIQLIPAINIMFFFGRFTFWLGYPRYRNFGFFINLVGLIPTVCYNFYKFVQMF